MSEISIIGLGTWGTALAVHLNKKKHKVVLYGRLEDNFNFINKNRYHPFLPKKKINKSIILTSNLTEAMKKKWIIIAVPSQSIRNLMKKMLKITNKEKKYIINVSKGMEIITKKRISEIVSEESNGLYKYIVLSGPTHAEEVIKNKLTASVVASKDDILAKKVQFIFNSENFRVYRSNDVIGVELGGILKNIIAIAAGFIDGKKLGDNAKAALISRGLKEMIDLGIILGAKKETFIGLSGLGDLIVTSNSKHSRNRMFGELFSKGVSPNIKMVTEGVNSVKAIYNLAKKNKVNMPIIQETYKVLYENKDPLISIKELMSRELKIEMEGA